MSHDIVDGVLAGLLGPHLAQWLSRYRYWAIFIVVMLGMHIVSFIVGAYTKGLEFAIQATLEKTFTPVGILVPIGIGECPNFRVQGELGITRMDE